MCACVSVRFGSQTSINSAVCLLVRLAVARENAKSNIKENFQLIWLHKNRNEWRTDGLECKLICSITMDNNRLEVDPIENPFRFKEELREYIGVSACVTFSAVCTNGSFHSNECGLSMTVYVCSACLRACMLRFKHTLAQLLSKKKREREKTANCY